MEARAGARDRTGGEERIDRLVGRHAELLSARRQEHRQRLSPPSARKERRRFTSDEVADLLGVKDACLRELHLEGRGPSPEIRSGGRRCYAPEEIRELRHMLEAGAKARGTYLPGRREGNHLQVVAAIDFKGGSAKTTTTAHLAQKAALDGYRVLAVDLDPQASLSALHGFRPEFDLLDGGTIHDAIRHEDPVLIARINQRTCFIGLDIVPGDLDLMAFEHETPRALTAHDGEPFFTRIGAALAKVEADYDLVVIDCPPQLGFISMAAPSAATAVLVTVHPQMLDVMSMRQFLLTTSNLLGVVSDAGDDVSHDWMRHLVTRHEPGDGPQNQMVGFKRPLFGEHVLDNPVLKSTAISDAGITKQTLYEVDRAQFTRATHERARASFDAVNGESEDAVNGESEALIQRAWGR